MGHRITREQALAVGRLIEAGGYSHRRIAAETGVSRGTVGAIARGERGLNGCDDPPLPPEEEDDADCGDNGCGRCVACLARDYLGPAADPVEEELPSLTRSEILERAAEVRAEWTPEQAAERLVLPEVANALGIDTSSAADPTEPEPVEIVQWGRDVHSVVIYESREEI